MAPEADILRDDAGVQSPGNCANIISGWSPRAFHPAALSREGLWLSYSLLIPVRRGLMDEVRGGPERRELLRTNKIEYWRPNTQGLKRPRPRQPRIMYHSLTPIVRKLYLRKCTEQNWSVQPVKQVHVRDAKETEADECRPDAEAMK